MAVESVPLPPQCLLSPYTVVPHRGFRSGPGSWHRQGPRALHDISQSQWSLQADHPAVFCCLRWRGDQLAQKKSLVIHGDFGCVTWDPSRRRLRYLGSLLEGMFQVAGWCSLGVLLGDAPFVLVCLCFVCFALRMSLLTPRLRRSKQRQYSVSPWSSLAPLDFDRSKHASFLRIQTDILFVLPSPVPRHMIWAAETWPVWLACQNILCLHHLLPFLFLKNTCFIFFLPHPPRISPWYLHIIHMSYIYILNSFIQSLSQSGSHSFINSFIQILWFMYIYNYIHKPASNHLFVARDLIWVLPSRQPWIQQPLLINDGFSGFPQIVIL